VDDASWADTKIAGFRPKSYKIPQEKASQPAAFKHENNNLRITQGERIIAITNPAP
jgi:hypothetical protein